MILEKVTPDKAVEAMSKYGGTVLKTSLSKDDEKELQEALHGSQAAAQQSSLRTKRSRRIARSRTASRRPLVRAVSS